MALALALQTEIFCEKDTIKSGSARERTSEDERESSKNSSSICHFSSFLQGVWLLAKFSCVEFSATLLCISYGGRNLSSGLMILFCKTYKDFLVNLLLLICLC